MQKHTVLIVEDEPSLLAALKDKLEKAEYEVMQAKNGEEGLAQALQHHPDIILLDVIMPKIDGIGLLKKLREDEWGKEAVVMILTNLSSNEKVAEVMDYGVHDYVIKSESKVDEIVQKVNAKLKNQ